MRDADLDALNDSLQKSIVIGPKVVDHKLRVHVGRWRRVAPPCHTLRLPGCCLAPTSSDACAENVDHLVRSRRHAHEVKVHAKIVLLTMKRNGASTYGNEYFAIALTSCTLLNFSGGPTCLDRTCQTCSEL